MTKNLVFPTFKEISLNDKEDYENYISKYPPYSDILFPTLQIWWNLEGNLSISYLRNNIVIHYSQPFDQENSGYCLIGDDYLDESINDIFNYLRDEHKKIRLVHMPEFMIKKIEDVNKFQIVEELDYNEYIIDCSAIVRLDTPEYSRIRKGINRFNREVDGKNVEIKKLDLASKDVRDLLLGSLEEWESMHQAKNDPLLQEKQAIHRTLSMSKDLGIRNICIYIDNELEGYVLYHRPKGKEYYVGHHLKVSYRYSYIFDYMIHQLAKKGLEHGIQYLNCEMDLGIESLRAHKMKLRPIDFFRKYTILPVTD